MDPPPPLSLLTFCPTFTFTYLDCVQTFFLYFCLLKLDSHVLFIYLFYFSGYICPPCTAQHFTEHFYWFYSSYISNRVCSFVIAKILQNPGASTVSGYSTFRNFLARTFNIYDVYILYRVSLCLYGVCVRRRILHWIPLHISHFHFRTTMFGHIVYTGNLFNMDAIVSRSVFFFDVGESHNLVKSQSWLSCGGQSEPKLFPPLSSKVHGCFLE